MESKAFSMCSYLYWERLQTGELKDANHSMLDALLNAIQLRGHSPLNLPTGLALPIFDAPRRCSQGAWEAAH